MTIYCPTCKALLGHFKNKEEADTHYPSGCPYCKNVQTADEKAASDALKAKGSRFVDVKPVEG